MLWNKRALIQALLIVLVSWTLAACRHNRSQPMATPSLTAMAPASDSASESPPSDAKIETDFLGLAGGWAECDHPDEAEMVCEISDGALRMEVDVNASTYARLRLVWEEGASPAFSGNETIYLHAKRTGEIKPNLYLVERDGERISVNLAEKGLREGWSDVVLPLGEFKDQEGKQPDFSDVNEIQIVFEWSDMHGVLAIDAMRVETAWDEEVAISQEVFDLADALKMPEGFAIEPIIDEVSSITQVQSVPDGSMLISLQNGRIWWYKDTDNDGQYDLRTLYAAGKTEVVGLLFDPIDGAVWFGGRGQLYRTFDADEDGVADLFELRVDGLPWGRHQNNGLAWNPMPDPFTGEAGGEWIYFGLGSTEDLEIGGDLNATVLRFPRDGESAEDLEIVSSGNRNAYDVVWAPVPVDLNAVTDGSPRETAWQLFASENGPDFNDAPDEVNHILWQHHYGFPEKFGSNFEVAASKIDGQPYTGSLYPVAAHASASGLTYISNPTWPAAYRTLYVSLFGQVFSEGIVGHTVERIELAPVEAPSDASPSFDTYRGEPSTFIEGLDRPLPLTVDTNGDMIVGDYAQGLVYRVRYVGE